MPGPRAAHPNVLSRSWAGRSWMRRPVQATAGRQTTAPRHRTRWPTLARAAGQAGLLEAVVKTRARHLRSRRRLNPRLSTPHQPTSFGQLVSGGMVRRTGPTRAPRGPSSQDAVPLVAQVVPPLRLRAVVPWPQPSADWHLVRRFNIEVRREPPTSVVSHGGDWRGGNGVAVAVHDEHPQPCDGEDVAHQLDRRHSQPRLDATDCARREPHACGEATLAEVGEPTGADHHASRAAPLERGWVRFH